MPSGAKKRKAAKRKLGKKDHNSGGNNNNNNNGSHSNSQGNDDPKTRDERNSDSVVVVESEGNFQGSDVNIHNEKCSTEVTVHTDDVPREFKKGNAKSSSSGSSSSSSSSDDDEIIVEKEKSRVTELGKLKAPVETVRVSEVVSEAAEESIPMEESVKQVVSLPQVSTSDVIESGLKQNVDDVSKQYDDKNKVASGTEKVEEKVIVVVDQGSENTSVPVSARDKTVKGCCADDDDHKVSESQKNSEEQPLLSTTPMPVRRTSWMDCCGLFEAFSGGSGR